MTVQDLIDTLTALDDDVKNLPVIIFDLDGGGRFEIANIDADVGDRVDIEIDSAGGIFYG